MTDKKENIEDKKAIDFEETNNKKRKKNRKKPNETCYDSIMKWFGYFGIIAIIGIIIAIISIIAYEKYIRISPIDSKMEIEKRQIENLLEELRKERKQSEPEKNPIVKETYSLEEVVKPNFKFRRGRLPQVIRDLSDNEIISGIFLSNIAIKISDIFDGIDSLRNELPYNKRPNCCAYHDLEGSNMNSINLITIYLKNSNTSIRLLNPKIIQRRIGLNITSKIISTRYPNKEILFECSERVILAYYVLDSMEKYLKNEKFIDTKIDINSRLSYIDLIGEDSICPQLRLRETNGEDPFFSFQLT